MAAEGERAVIVASRCRSTGPSVAPFARVIVTCARTHAGQLDTLIVVRRRRRWEPAATSRRVARPCERVHERQAPGAERAREDVAHVPSAWELLRVSVAAPPETVELAEATVLPLRLSVADADWPLNTPASVTLAVPENCAKETATGRRRRCRLVAVAERLRDSVLRGDAANDRVVDVAGLDEVVVLRLPDDVRRVVLPL